MELRLSCINSITHWDRVMHIWVSNLTIIGSDNGLSADRLQAIIWTNANILLIGHLWTNFSEILIKIHTFSSQKMHLKKFGKWRPFCLGLNVLTHQIWQWIALKSTPNIKTFKTTIFWNQSLHFNYIFSFIHLPSKSMYCNRLSCMSIRKHNFSYYRKTSSINHTKSQNLTVSRVVLQLSLPNPLKPGVK